MKIRITWDDGMETNSEVDAEDMLTALYGLIEEALAAERESGAKMVKIEIDAR